LEYWSGVVSGRTILLAVAASLFAGCGRSDHATVGQSSQQPADEITATAASSPPQAADDCPGRGAPHRIRPKRAAQTHTKVAVEPDGRGVRIGPVRLVAPKNWIPQKPPAEIALVEFSLPRADGDTADAQLTVAPIAGSDPKSLDRLREHLKHKPEEGSLEHLRIGGNEVVLMDSSGDYGDTGGPFPSPVGEGRYRVLSAMVFVGGKVYFVNCTGPEKTVGQRAAEFRAFLQTMKPVDQP
jgi:hypothetical protein